MATENVDTTAKAQQVTSETNWAIIKRNPENFLARFVSVDESWVYHYDLESKSQAYNGGIRVQHSLES